VAPESLAPIAEEESGESFADLLSAFEKSHTHKSVDGQKQLIGTVVSLSDDQVFVDIGYKTEGVLPRSDFDDNADKVKPRSNQAIPSRSPSRAVTRSAITN
jgi:small subunit ribosomal protein S1